MYLIQNGLDNSLAFGQEYYPYYTRSNTSPFLYNDIAYSSSIVFDGKKYENVNIKYDTKTDELIYIEANTYTQFNSVAPLKISFDANGDIISRFDAFFISLNEDKIDSFSFYIYGDTVTFYRLGEKDGLPTRFYEVPYYGKSRFVIKHFCSVYTEKSIEEYKIREAYYVDIGSGFQRIITKGQFFKLFGEDKELVKSIIMQNGISFNKKDKRQIINILQKYDQFINQTSDNI